MKFYSILFALNPIYLFLINNLLLIDINNNLSVTSTTDIFQSRFRYARYGDVDNCGKRKRNLDTRRCFKMCTSNADCRGTKRRCLCDGECGLSCVRITQTCANVGEFRNGKTYYNPDNHFGSHLIYECNPGYTLVGNKIRVCEGDGWWSGTSPVCTKEVYCDNPPTIENAMANIQLNSDSKYKMGTEIEYQCDSGFIGSEDHNKSTCEESGKWSEIKYQCSKITCSEPDPIENGIINGNDYTYSSLVEYNCLPGYRRVGNDYLRECLINGQWSGQVPKCEPVNCGDPPKFDNTIRSFNLTVFGSKVNYMCLNKRFILEGSNELECLDNGQWSIEYIPKCIERNCTLDTSQVFKNGYIVNSNEQSLGNQAYPVGTTIELECNKNYEFIGSRQMTCLITGNWDEKIPLCKLDVHCPIITAPQNGVLITTKLETPKGYPYDTVLEFNCSPGFELRNSVTRRCGINGTWTGKDTVCFKLPTPSTTTASSTSTEVEREYELIPSKLKELVPQNSDNKNISNGLFNSCKIDSTISKIILNKIVIFNNLTENYVEHGETIFYTCNNSDDSHVATCNNGTLEFDVKCTENNSTNVGKSCKTPNKIPNGYLKLGSYLHGSKALYKCFNGYELRSGDKEIRCENGEWVGRAPICYRISCGYPGTLQNGRILYVGTDSEYTYQPYMTSIGQNKHIKYVCESGYKLIGVNGSTCINGNWKPSLTMIKCVKDKLFNKNYDVQQINDVNDNPDVLVNSNLANYADESPGVKPNLVNYRFKQSKLDRKSENEIDIKDNIENKPMNSENGYSATAKTRKTKRLKKRLKKNKRKSNNLIENDRQLVRYSLKNVQLN